MSGGWHERGAQALVALLGVACAAVVAAKREPARAAEAPSPASAAGSSALAPSASAAPPSRARGVALRLTERLGSAVVDAPNLASTDANLDYWRRMRSPWVEVPQSLAGAVEQVSLVRSSGKAGKQSLEGGSAWVPDPHVWNMNDGSFDQREGILAPPPATLSFPKIAVPDGASFEAGVGVMGAGLGGVSFELTVKPSDGAAKLVKSVRAEGSKGEGFRDFVADLGAWAGKTVDLELRTRALEPGATAPAAVWADPVIVAPDASDLPFNVLFIVVDAMRADALSSTHDPETDAKMAAANPPPLDAWLPNLPEVAPNLDAIAKHGVRFTRAYSAATWTRPGTLAMLTGNLSSELGLSALPLIPPPAGVRSLYAKKPAFLPLVLRPHGAITEAVVNNFYMVGYVGVGVDMGFESMIDHRYQLEDTAEILEDSLAALERDKSRRFCMFVNFVSPHVPYQPPPSAMAAIPEPPRAPAEKLVRQYLAEIHKDDAAIGALWAALEKLGIRDDTLVVVTADHGETLSVEHDAVPDGVDGGPEISGRFHHLSSLYDETAHVPLLLVWPKHLPADTRVVDPVSAVDIVPTILDLAGISRPANVSGQSLVPLVKGARAPERTIWVEGRGAHAIRAGRYRLVVRDPEYKKVHTKGRHVDKSLELYDLEADPGERVEIGKQHPDVVERLLALDEARQRGSGASAAPSPAAGEAHAKTHLRFAGGGARHHVTGRIDAQVDGKPAHIEARLLGLPPESIHEAGAGIELDFDTPSDFVVGLDLAAEPADADIVWQLAFDGQPWAAAQVYAGSLGLVARTLVGGVKGDVGRRAASADVIPYIDPEHDLGLFVARDAVGRELELGTSDAAKQEAMGLMRAWGYVR